MKRFIVAASPLSEHQTNAITALFRSGYGWWHWIENLWLVTDRSETLTCTTIRDQIKGVAPNARIMVINADDPDNWAGTASSGRATEMFKWIRGTWASG